MIDYSKMSDLREAVKNGNKSNEEIMQLARELVDADDGYTYARVWVYGYSKNIYIGFNFVTKYYDDCPNEEYNKKVLDFLMNKFPEMELTQLVVDYVDDDSYLIGTEFFDLLIDKENEDGNTCENN